MGELLSKKKDLVLVPEGWGGGEAVVVTLNIRGWSSRIIRCTCETRLLNRLPKGVGYKLFEVTLKVNRLFSQNKKKCM